MTSSTMNWASYPPAYPRIVEAACQRQLRIPCLNEKDARRTEGKLKAFVGALYRAAAKDPAMEGMATMGRRVKFKTEGSEVVCMPRDLDSDNLAALAALGEDPAQARVRTLPVDEVGQAAAESFRNLQKLLAGDEPNKSTDQENYDPDQPLTPEMMADISRKKMERDTAEEVKQRARAYGAKG